ncbi:unnamed protein product, partial [Closterium sp. NIES-53]
AALRLSATPLWISFRLVPSQWTLLTLRFTTRPSTVSLTPMTSGLTSQCPTMLATPVEDSRFPLPLFFLPPLLLLLPLLCASLPAVLLTVPSIAFSTSATSYCGLWGCWSWRCWHEVLGVGMLVWGVLELEVLELEVVVMGVLTLE